MEGRGEAAAGGGAVCDNAGCERRSQRELAAARDAAGGGDDGSIRRRRRRLRLPWDTGIRAHGCFGAPRESTFEVQEGLNCLRGGASETRERTDFESSSSMQLVFFFPQKIFTPTCNFFSSFFFLSETKLFLPRARAQKKRKLSPLYPPKCRPLSSKL